MNRNLRNKLPVVVSGGGIGGLACALALAQKGFGVIVCEQAPQFGQVGAGLQVAPNALSVLDALGVGNEVKSQALLVKKMLMMDAISGNPVCSIPCGDEFQSRFGNPYAVAHRADVHGALLRACEAHENVTLKNNFKIVEYKDDGDGVQVRSEAGDVVAAAALVGADGVRSKIRQQMKNDGDPIPVGAVIYRTLVPASAMPRDLQHPFPTLWTGPDAHLIYYPVRDWAQFNVGATVNRSVEDIVEGEAGLDEALAAFENWNEIPLRVLKLSSTYQRYVIRHRPPTDNWGAGNVVLLGDAAHPMVQYIAQGAAMALEDAVCLASQVDANNGDFSAAYASYQAIRIVRTARVQISSLMLDRIYHVGGVERLVRNSIFEGRSPSDYFDRLSWLFAPPDYVTNWSSMRT